MGRGGNTGMFVSNRQREDKRLFEKEYDFEQANTQFEELRVQLSNSKISGASTTPAGPTENGDVNGEKDKKEDSSVEPVGGEEDKEQMFYDKTKSFFDTISCEAVERSEG